MAGYNFYQELRIESYKAHKFKQNQYGSEGACDALAIMWIKQQLYPGRDGGFTLVSGAAASARNRSLFNRAALAPKARPGNSDEQQALDQFVGLNAAAYIPVSGLDTGSIDSPAAFAAAVNTLYSSVPPRHGIKISVIIPDPAGIGAHAVAFFKPVSGLGRFYDSNVGEYEDIVDIQAFWSLWLDARGRATSAMFGHAGRVAIIPPTNSHSSHAKRWSWYRIYC